MIGQRATNEIITEVVVRENLINKETYSDIMDYRKFNQITAGC